MLCYPETLLDVSCEHDWIIKGKHVRVGSQYQSHCSPIERFCLTNTESVTWSGRMSTVVANVTVVISKVTVVAKGTGVIAKFYDKEPTSSNSWTNITCSSPQPVMNKVVRKQS